MQRPVRRLCRGQLHPVGIRLTPYIKDTDNRLCVEVYKRSSAAWIEDQDFFRFSGIFRSVYLYAKPKVHINDIWLRADLAADNTTGLLTPLVKLDGETDGASVALVVSDPEGYAVYRGPPPRAIRLRSRASSRGVMQRRCSTTPY